MGVCCGGAHRGFFTFDLARLRGHVVFARLDLFTGSVAGDARGTVGFFDVGTPPDVLNANDGISEQIFADLGSGKRYGTVELRPDQSDQWVSVPLNRMAVRDINAATGFFSIGGRLLTVDDEPDEQYVGGNTHERQLTARLVLRMAPGRLSSRP